VLSEALRESAFSYCCRRNVADMAREFLAAAPRVRWPSAAVSPTMKGMIEVGIFAKGRPRDLYTFGLGKAANAHTLLR